MSVTEVRTGAVQGVHFVGGEPFDSVEDVFRRPEGGRTAVMVGPREAELR